jgi:hypothetical protein
MSRIHWVARATGTPKDRYECRYDERLKSTTPIYIQIKRMILLQQMGNFFIIIIMNR